MAGASSSLLADLLLEKAREQLQAEFDKEHSSRRSKKQPTMDEVKEKVYEILKEPVKGAVLAGQFSDYLQAMINKHITFEIRDYGDNCYIISCFDGCSHSAGKNKFDVITFSEQLHSKTVQEKNISTCHSCQILTHRQVLSKEIPSVVIDSVKGYYKEKKAAVEKPQNFLKKVASYTAMIVMTLR